MHYPEGVPQEINPDQFSSLNALFDWIVKTFADRPAVMNFGTALTYSELNQRATAFAAFAQKELGLVKGDRVAVMMPNLIQYMIVLFGAFKAGLTIVNVNPLYTARELQHQLKDAGANTIVVLENFAHTLQSALPDLPDLKHIIVTEIGDAFPLIKRCLMNFVVKYIKKMVPNVSLLKKISFRAAMKKGAKLSLAPVDVLPTDLAFLQYTGGTTGVAKGAMLTHRNMVANVEQAYHWIKPFMEIGNEAIITALPLYHIFSLLANCLVFSRLGSCNVLITNPRDMKNFIAQLKRTRFTGMTGVNTLFNALVNKPEFVEVNFSRLKVVLGGGMSVQHAVAERWKQITGSPILEAYGLTETCPAVTINPMTLKDYNSSIGLPIPSTNVKVIDNKGNDLPLGEIGELCIQGPQVMKGYWNQPKETEKVLGKDGWLKTGDVARIDEQGFVYIVDRKKDMVDISGFNVYPNEVENVIAEHPDVLEVAVIGIPDKKTGEALKAFIVTKNDELTPEALKAFCRKSLTPYKVPHYYEFRKELPKTNVGKILRRALKEEVS